MLVIQSFIRDHPDNWQELLSATPYNLKISEDDGFVLFKYNQISSDFNEEICKEARGLILDSTDNFKVVRMAFKKFFNLGERFAAHIDWDSAVASEKIDGSIMSVWFARGKWHLSTNGTIDAFKAEINGVSPYKTFGDLFESVLPLSTFIGNRYERVCFTFELVSPYNKIVIDYPETKVYLLTARNMSFPTLIEYDDYGTDVFARELGVARPQRYALYNEEAYRQLVADMPEGHEGVVVCDANTERVKIKTLLYFQLHRMVNNGNITLERVVDLIRANDTDEFLSYFPEYTPYFNKVKQTLFQIEVSLNTIDFIVQKTKAELEEKFAEKVAKKEFAKIYSSFELSHVYFAVYDGTLEKKIDNMSTSQFIKFFKPFFKGVE